MHAHMQVKRFLPYGEGSHVCVGMPLARVNMLATLATLLGRFTFRLADKARCPCHAPKF